MFPKISNEAKIFVILFTIFFVTASGNIDSIDANTSIFLAKKIVLEHKIHFNAGENSLGMPVFHDKATGHYLPIYNFGYALMLIPSILTSIFIRKLLSVPLPNYPFTPDYIIILYDNLLNGLLISLCGVLIYKIAILFDSKLRKRRGIACIVSCAVLSTTLATQGHQSFAHPLFIFTFLSSFYCLIKYIQVKTPLYMLLFSVTFAMTAASYNATFILLIPALLLFHFLETKRFNFYLLLSFIPAVAIQLIWNFMRFGSIFKTGYFEIGLTIFDFNLLHILQRVYGMTFAPNKGFFIFNPLMLLPVVAIAYHLFKERKYKYIGLISLSITLFLSYIGNYSLATIWHGDATYGPRYLSPLLPIGIILFLLFYEKIVKEWSVYIIIFTVAIGILIQVPGFTIPSFAFPFLSPSICLKKQDIYFYNWKCSPIKVGWSHLLKRRIKETIMTTGSLSPQSAITNKYPNPPTAFRTLYPDPLFNPFSQYSAPSYSTSKAIMNDVYSFTVDTWWIKAGLYRNISNR